MSVGPLTFILSKKNQREEGKRGIAGLCQDEGWAEDCLGASLPTVFASTAGFIQQEWETENSCSSSVLIIHFFAATVSVKAKQAKGKKKIYQTLLLFFV